MVLVNSQSPTKKAVGCIFTFESKYLMFHRVKDGFWNSISGNFESPELSQDAIRREIKEEIGLDLRPEKIAVTYHKYGSEIVEYHLYAFKFGINPLDIINLNEEHDKMDLFLLKDALKLKLFEDEDFCLKLYNKKVLE